MNCHCHLSADFENGNKKLKTFLKGEEILLLIRKFYRKIRRKLIISYSNRMQPQRFNASKAQQAIPAGSLKKRELSKNTHKNKLDLVTEVDEPETL